MTGPRGSMGDLIVVGAEAAGLSAAWAASLMGFSVTCIEARRVGHPAASSAGLVKILRYAYESEKFSRLLVGAERRWRDLEARSGRRLIRRCASLNIGAAGSPPIASVISSLDAAQRKYEVLRPGSSRLAILGMRLFPHEEAVLEIDAGVISPDTVLAALSREARKNGVRIVEGVTVREIAERSAGLRVETDFGRFMVDRVIVAVGPWLPDLIPAPPIPLTVTRQRQLMFGTDRPIGNGRPLAWAEMIHDDGYGVINTTYGRHVVGSHAPGPVVASARATNLEPDHDAVRIQAAAFQDRLIGDIRIKQFSTRLCHYTSTANADFLVSRCADVPGTVLLSACSGHGFKFVLSTGYRAAELATT